MRFLLVAELRKSWKTKKIGIAILCFLCFIACSYLFCIQKDIEHNQKLVRTLHFQNTIIGDKANDLLYQLQHMPSEEEPPGMQETYDLYMEAYLSNYDWSVKRQASLYFGWDSVTTSAKKAVVNIQALRNSVYYDGALDEGEQNVKDMDNDVRYYTYLAKHNIAMYSSPYEPNLLNFFLQIFQNETMILFLMIAAFFMADQLCTDFECGTYKQLYAMPLSRIKFMCVKVLHAILLMTIAFITAFLLFSFIPIMQHGFGSLHYPYVVNDTCIPFTTLCVQILPLIFLVILFYMSICVWFSIVLRNISNTLLAVAGILLFVFISMQYGISEKIITWLPIFYVYPMEIISNTYGISYIGSIALCIACIIVMVVLFRKNMEQYDLKGSDGS